MAKDKADAGEVTAREKQLVKDKADAGDATAREKQPAKDKADSCVEIAATKTKWAI